MQDGRRYNSVYVITNVIYPLYGSNGFNHLEQRTQYPLVRVITCLKFALLVCNSSNYNL